MYGTFYTQSEHKALEIQLKRAEAKIAKQAETIKSLKAELKRVKTSADDLSAVVFDKPVDVDELNTNLDDLINTSLDDLIEDSSL